MAKRNPFTLVQPARKPLSSIPITGGRAAVNNAEWFAEVHDAAVREENRRRYILQSSRTVAGQAAPLPSLEEATA